jgi:hypothetical protein
MLTFQTHRAARPRAPDLGSDPNPIEFELSQRACRITAQEHCALSNASRRSMAPEAPKELVVPEFARGPFALDAEWHGVAVSNYKCALVLRGEDFSKGEPRRSNCLPCAPALVLQFSPAPPCRASATRKKYLKYFRVILAGGVFESIADLQSDSAASRASRFFEHVAEANATLATPARKRFTTFVRGGYTVYAELCG